MSIDRIKIEIADGDHVFDSIIKAIKEMFEESELDPDIEARIDSLIERIGDHNHYLIEYPYVDKLYRDSYYNYFSSKHNNYNRDVVRVCVFSEQISYEDFRNPESFERLETLLIGYFIIRPTMPRIFGRSVFSKEIQQNALACSYTDSISVNGVKMRFNGFAHSSQDAENISCAETSLWVIMEYFSSKYSYFKSVLPSEIFKVLNVKSDERLRPTDGLTVQQISYALKEFGFGTKIYSHENFNIKEIMMTYLDSGIPFIANLTDLNAYDITHAVVVFGKEAVTDEILDKWRGGIDEKGSQYFDCSDLDRKFLIMDDNQFPYTLVQFEAPFSDSPDDHFNIMEFHSIVVPLYPKIYLEASQAKSLIINILMDDFFGYHYPAGYVTSFFLASSRSFKMHITSQQDLDGDIKDDLISIPMPKFIWCLEISANIDTYKKSLGNGLLIIDATEMNKVSISSLIFAGYPDRFFTNYNNKLLSLQTGFDNYSLYNHNLV